jgi:UDP-N-acetylmuramate dehydrogenase
VGEAQVYEHHANIIVNRGHATARQVLRLAEEMQRRVRERFGVQLVPEVRIFTDSRR